MMIRIIALSAGIISGHSCTRQVPKVLVLMNVRVDGQAMEVNHLSVRGVMFLAELVSIKAWRATLESV